MGLPNFGTSNDMYYNVFGNLSAKKIYGDHLTKYFSCIQEKSINNIKSTNFSNKALPVYYVNYNHDCKLIKYSSFS